MPVFRAFAGIDPGTTGIPDATIICASATSPGVMTWP